MALVGPILDVCVPAHVSNQENVLGKRLGALGTAENAVFFAFFALLPSCMSLEAIFSSEALFANRTLERFVGDIHVRLEMLFIGFFRVARFVAHLANRYLVGQLGPDKFVNFPLMLQRAGSSSEWLMAQLAKELFVLDVPMAGTVLVPRFYGVERFVTFCAIQGLSLAAWRVAFQPALFVEALVASFTEKQLFVLSLLMPLEFSFV